MPKWDDAVVLVAKIVPPGSATLPPRIMLIPGDSLTVMVETQGDIEMKWESTFLAHMLTIVEFDYMEIKAMGSQKGKIFTEVHHEEVNL